MRPGRFPRHWLLVLLLPVAVPLWAQALPQKIRGLQTEAIAEPFHEHLVQTKGIVTWVDKTAGKVFYIQDDTGGIRVKFVDSPWPRIGDRVVVRGTLTRGSFSSDIVDASVQKVGTATLPAPRNASAGGLLNGAFNGEFVAINAWVRSAKMITPSTLTLVLSPGLDRITVRIADAAGLIPKDLIAAQIIVHGVASPIRARGSLRQLVEVQILAAGPKCLQILNKPGQQDVWTLPFTSFAEAFQYRPGQTRGDRVRVRGQIVLQDNGVAYLNDGKSGLAMRGAGIDSLRPGDWVEAAGFADLENFLPVLADANFRPSKPRPDKIVPREFPAAALMDGLQHANYVTVTGRLLDLMRQPAVAPGRDDLLVMALQSPRGVFKAEFEGKDPGRLLPRLEAGATLQISGVCVVQTDAEGNTVSFKILVPDTSQIRVVRPASFFTVKRLLVLLCVTLTILLLVALLTVFFARRNIRLKVEAQERQNELHERQAISAERNRLARDLHDTLEQGLTSIRLQLQSIGPEESEASSRTQKRLAAVRTLVQQCHVEMRRSVWNLRSVATEKFDLGQALERSARSLVLGSPIRVDFRQRREDVQIPPLIEDNLLRIGQEALTNAIKHAGATLLTIDLEVTSERAILTVSDNGGGMKAPSERDGRFGLVGMQERAARIGGELSITGLSPTGTSVRIEAPLNFGNAAALTHS